MNRFMKQSGSGHSRKQSRYKKIALSVVILLEVIAAAFIVVHAWVETVSSIKITNETNTVGSITTTVVKTDALIGNKSGTIDLADYFKPSGNMHFAPASSADGKTFYFPKAGATNIYRKGTAADINTTYLSVTFRLKADTNADFFFVSQPAISVADDIRVSVTAYTEGGNPEGIYDSSTGKLISNTKIYANDASTTPVVNSTSGATGATVVEKFSDHTKGKSSTYRLFAVGANETKIVTINIWLQKKTSDNSDLTNSMSVSQAINNLGITSSLTPRHVTLIPTPTWDTSSNEYFYAWCWDATNGDLDRLYKLDLDDNEHYSFDYNGTYQSTLFFRSGNGNLTTDIMNANNKAAWSDGTIWNKTEDTSIPNDPVDPTYIIETINGSSEIDTSSGSNSTNKKSTGSWHDPVTVKLAYVTNQTSAWGTLSATTYIGTTTSSHVMEATNSSNDNSKHKDTVHAWAGKKMQLKATAKSGYRFVGWYDNVDGTGTALSTNATYELNAPSTSGGESIYFAKFVEIRSLTIYRYLDNESSSIACGTITIDETSSTSGASASKTFDKGASVEFSASAAEGYTLSGIYTTATGTTPATSPININSNTTYYARFTTISYNVTASAYYSTNGGSSYTAGDTGGTVKAGSEAAGASSTSSVKYKSSVSLVAEASSGYVFDGWYTADTGGTKLSGNSTYTYSLNTIGDKNVYARFIREDWAIKYGAHNGSNWSTVNMTVSGNNVTGTMTLTEGQEFSFKLYKKVGSAETWYGASSASYSDITSTSFISNLSLTNNNGSDYDINMKGHAGTYTFTFNKSSNVLNVTVSYSNITITLIDNTNNHWLGNDNAIFYLDCSGYSGVLMTKGTNQWTALIPSNTRITNITFKRNDPDNTTTWDSWSWSNRGYNTSYTVN